MLKEISEKRGSWEIKYCPLCDRLEWVQKGKNLKLCARCLMDKSDAYEKKALATYDWAKTIVQIRREKKWTQQAFAWWLGLSPAHLSNIKNGRMVMPPQSLEKIKENFMEKIVLVENKKKQQVMA